MANASQQLAAWFEQFENTLVKPFMEEISSIVKHTTPTGKFLKFSPALRYEDGTYLGMSYDVERDAVLIHTEDEWGGRDCETLDRSLPYNAPLCAAIAEQFNAGVYTFVEVLEDDE